MLELTPRERIVHTRRVDAGEMGVFMGNETSIMTVMLRETSGVTLVTTNIHDASEADRDAAFATCMTEVMAMNDTLLDGVLGGL